MPWNNPHPSDRHHHHHHHRVRGGGHPNMNIYSGGESGWGEAQQQHINYILDQQEGRNCCGSDRQPKEHPHHLVKPTLSTNRLVRFSKDRPVWYSAWLVLEVLVDLITFMSWWVAEAYVVNWKETTFFDYDQGRGVMLLQGVCSMFTLSTFIVRLVLNFQTDRLRGFLLSFSTLCVVLTSLPGVIVMLLNARMWIPFYLRVWDGHKSVLAAAHRITSLSTFDRHYYQRAPFKILVVAMEWYVGLIIAMGTMHAAMNFSVPKERYDETAYDDGFLSIFQAYYFMLVTFCTLGYGDISGRTIIARIVGTCVIIYAIGRFPGMFTKMTAVRRLMKFKTPFSSRRGTRSHIIIAGEFDTEKINFILHELFSQINSHASHIVLLNTAEYPFDVKILIEEVGKADHVHVLRGSPSNLDDLKRCDAGYATAIYILSSDNIPPAAADADALLSSTQAHLYDHNLPQHVVLRGGNAYIAEELSSLGVNSVLDKAKLRYSLLGLACVCPGAASIISSMLWSTKSKSCLCGDPTDHIIENDTPYDETTVSDREWRKMYEWSIANRYFVFDAPMQLNGRTFHDAVRVYRTAGVTLMGVVEYYYSPNRANKDVLSSSKTVTTESVVLLNPKNYTIRIPQPIDGNPPASFATRSSSPPNGSLSPLVSRGDCSNPSLAMSYGSKDSPGHGPSFGFSSRSSSTSSSHHHRCNSRQRGRGGGSRSNSSSRYRNYSRSRPGSGNGRGSRQNGKRERHTRQTGSGDVGDGGDDGSMGLFPADQLFGSMADTTSSLSYLHHGKQPSNDNSKPASPNRTFHKSHRTPTPLQRRWQHHHRLRLFGVAANKAAVDSVISSMSRVLAGIDEARKMRKRSNSSFDVPMMSPYVASVGPVVDIRPRRPNQQQEGGKDGVAVEAEGGGGEGEVRKQRHQQGNKQNDNSIDGTAESCSRSRSRTPSRLRLPKAGTEIFSEELLSSNDDPPSPSKAALKASSSSTVDLPTSGGRDGGEEEVKPHLKGNNSDLVQCGSGGSSNSNSSILNGFDKILDKTPAGREPGPLRLENTARPGQLDPPDDMTYKTPQTPPNSGGNPLTELTPSRNPTPPTQRRPHPSDPFAPSLAPHHHPLSHLNHPSTTTKATRIEDRDMEAKPANGGTSAASPRATRNKAQGQKSGRHGGEDADEEDHKDEDASLENDELLQLQQHIQMDTATISADDERKNDNDNCVVTPAVVDPLDDINKTLVQQQQQDDAEALSPDTNTQAQRRDRVPEGDNQNRKVAVADGDGQERQYQHQHHHKQQHQQKKPQQSFVLVVDGEEDPYDINNLGTPQSLCTPKSPATTSASWNAHSHQMLPPSLHDIGISHTDGGNTDDGGRSISSQQHQRRTVLTLDNCSPTTDTFSFAATAQQRRQQRQERRRQQLARRTSSVRSGGSSLSTSFTSSTPAVSPTPTVDVSEPTDDAAVVIRGGSHSPHRRPPARRDDHSPFAPAHQSSQNGENESAAATHSVHGDFGPSPREDPDKEAHDAPLAFAPRNYTEWLSFSGEPQLPTPDGVGGGGVVVGGGTHLDVSHSSSNPNSPLFSVENLQGHVLLIDLWSVQRTQRQIVSEATEEFRAFALFSVVRAIKLQDPHVTLLLLSRGAMPEKLDRYCTEAGYADVLHVDGCGLYADHLYECSAHKAKACLVFSSISGAGQDEDADVEALVVTAALEKIIEEYVEEQEEEYGIHQQSASAATTSASLRTVAAAAAASSASPFDNNDSFRQLSLNSDVAVAVPRQGGGLSAGPSAEDGRGQTAVALDCGGVSAPAVAATVRSDVYIHRPRVLTEVQTKYGMSLIPPFYSEGRLNRLMDEDLAHVPSLFVGKAVPMSLVDSAIFQNTISPEIIPVVTSLICGLTHRIEEVRVFDSSSSSSDDDDGEEWSECNDDGEDDDIECRSHDIKQTQQRTRGTQDADDSGSAADDDENDFDDDVDDEEERAGGGVSGDFGPSASGAFVTYKPKTISHLRRASHLMKKENGTSSTAVRKAVTTTANTSEEKRRRGVVDTKNLKGAQKFPPALKTGTTGGRSEAGRQLMRDIPPLREDVDEDGEGGEEEEDEEEKDRASLSCMTCPSRCKVYRDVEHICLRRGLVPLGLHRLIIDSSNEYLRGHRFMFLNPSSKTILRPDDIVYFLL